MPPREGLIAAVDQGSTATKGAVFAPDGRCLGRAEVKVERAIDGVRVEHDPAGIAAGLRQVLAELGQKGSLAALGLTCQRSTCLLWERATGRPLTPALSWQDRRQAAAVQALAAHGDDVARRTGLRLSPHYAAPKLRSLLEGLPRGLERARAGEWVAGTLDAFLVRQLTGQEATEGGQAGRTLLYNLEEDRWDPELCRLFGIPGEALPRLRSSVGEWGDVEGAPLAVVLGDQQAALLGHGGWEPGVAAAHFGTGAFVLVSTGRRLLRSPDLLSAVVASVPEERRFQLEGSVNSAGSAVDWVARLLGEDLSDWEEQSLDPEKLPWVFPAFAGAAAPWWRPEASGMVAGLTLSTTGADLLAGVLSGVAMRVLDCVEALEAAGAPIDVLRVSGRLTRLQGLVGLVADAGGWAVEVAAEEELGLRGVFRMAARGLDLDAGEVSVPTAWRREPRWRRERAERVRQRWREFVARALEIPAVTSDGSLEEEG